MYIRGVLIKMSYRETYDMLDRASKRFKIRSDDNATNTDSQRTASVANNVKLNKMIVYVLT